MPAAAARRAMTDALIRSRSNPLVKRLRALKERGADDLALVEGFTLVEEALGAGVELVEAVAGPRAEKTARGKALVGRLAAAGVVVRRVDDAILDSLSETETSQGLLALARRPSFDEDAVYAGTPLVVVAVAVQNPGNVGALLRTAEAAGATGAYLTAGTADPLSWKALRGAMGSAFRLPHVHGIPVEQALARLHQRQVTLLATVAEGGQRYDTVDLRGPVAFLLGSEGSGLPSELVAKADARITIPMAGATESLNVSVAAGVLLFEAARQRRAAR
jgi:TrmH family RNA methyltransferase